jgi:hypothetical protein
MWDSFTARRAPVRVGVGVQVDAGVGLVVETVTIRSVEIMTWATVDGHNGPARRNVVEGENLRPVTCVVIDEVRSGDWGIGGNAFTTADVHALQGSGTGSGRGLRSAAVALAPWVWPVRASSDRERRADVPASAWSPVGVAGPCRV